MRVGICGIGSIAQKAYLPFITQIEDVELVLCSRNKEILHEVMEQYHLKEAYTDMEPFLQSGLDAVLVTSATSAHDTLVRKVLSYGIPCHVDKPLCLNEEDTRKLIEHARDLNVPLMVGFNRRFVPHVQRLMQKGKPELVIYQKHRVDGEITARQLVFDDFIHVLDTSLMLLQDDVTEVIARGFEENGFLKHVVVNLITPSNQAVCIMNYRNGYNEERCEINFRQERYVIQDLSQLSRQANNEMITDKGSDWIPKLVQRGFEPMIKAFLYAVKQGEEMPVKYDTVLKSHSIAEEVVRQLKSARVPE